MSSALFPHLPQPQQAGDRKIWGELYGPAMAAAICEVTQKNAGVALILCADNPTAQRLEEELQFFLPQHVPLFEFPDWETLPYDRFSPHQDIISRRLQALYEIPRAKQAILILPATTVCHRIAPRNFIEKHSFMLNPGAKFDIETSRRDLEQRGYRCVSQVEEHGEFAVRGSLVDLFPMGSRQPYRIDLFDNEVESIRHFDPSTQRSGDKQKQIRLLPGQEFPLDADAIALFRQNWREAFEGDPTQCPIYQAVSKGKIASGLEYYLPLFFNETATLFDYLPSNTHIFTVGNIEHAVDSFYNEARDRYDQLCGDREYPLLKPQQVFLPTEQLFASLKKFPRIELLTGPAAEKAGSANAAARPMVDVSIDAKRENPLEKLQLFLPNHQHVLFCAETAGRRESMLELLNAHGINPTKVADWHEFIAKKPHLAITIANLDAGFQLPRDKLTIIAEPDLYGKRIMQRRRRKRNGETAEHMVKNLTELQEDAPVVHIDFGVGRYKGLQTLEAGGQRNEFLVLEYADGDKLYVPVASLHLISRYTGADLEHAPLQKLGTNQWQKVKRRAAEKARDVAVELLNLYARREARVGTAMPSPDLQYHTFADAFPFEETPDQQSAIAAVIHDLSAAKPMDRVVCGDVGFGKTEVAMRAAFVSAVQANKQVCILVPTTLLAQQHYETFKDRFADWPITIEAMSRFQSKKKQDEIIEKLKTGQVDIVIGTHKLLSNQIQFKDLGLVIVDEEHRFGVQQKEKLKAMRAEVDILTLTATPIPRTLNMALSGIRDLSIIATPPSRRLSIKTFVRQSQDNLVREAILREIMRGGQVYFVHNDVATIEATADAYQKLVPEAKFEVAHGQMRERELEQIMSDFYHQKFTVLVCSTIIETGIDIPSANTIIIDRADRLGLAQLHQLRGRVGRSHHQAYAYLLTPPRPAMTPDAIKRLDAIAALGDLGAGFTLATHDLEIRGAGELLGAEQSGNIECVGFTLYMDMLERAVDALKSGREPDLDSPLGNGTEIDLKVSALIPNDYLPDIHSRLTLYKRIASAKNAKALDELQDEMQDRFGPIPDETQNLFRITALKQHATPLGIKKIDAGIAGGRVLFNPHAKANPLAIIDMIQKQAKIFQLERGDVLRFRSNLENVNERFVFVERILQRLG